MQSIIIVGLLLVIGLLTCICVLLYVTMKGSGNPVDKKIDMEEEYKKVIIERKKSADLPPPRMNYQAAESPINSRGELIPFNLSESEKELLRDFYGRN